jgi:hypothetical protein
MASHRTLFKEVQHLPRTLVYVIVIVLLVILGYLYSSTYNMYLNETSIRGWSRAFKLVLAGMVVLTFFILGLIYIVWSYKLVTKVSVRSFYFKLPPIKNKYKKISTMRILSVKHATTDKLPRGTVKIKMTGKEGVLMELEDDKKAFIGSQHAESLEKAFQKMLDNA